MGKSIRILIAVWVISVSLHAACVTFLVLRATFKISELERKKPPHSGEAKDG